MPACPLPNLHAPPAHPLEGGRAAGRDETDLVAVVGEHLLKYLLVGARVLPLHEDHALGHELEAGAGTQRLEELYLLPVGLRLCHLVARVVVGHDEEVQR